MKKLLSQAVRFVGLSGIGWILDFATYTILGVWSFNLVLNNTISSWVGVTFVFLFSTRAIFQNNSRISLKWKYVIYLFYQCGLIFFISRLLNILNTYIVTNVSMELVRNFSTIISKIIVTPVTMMLNFFVMKGVVENL